MPHRPSKSKGKVRKNISKFISYEDTHAVDLLKNSGLFDSVNEKRLANLKEVDDNEETVYISIGAIIRLNTSPYVAHVYGIDNFEDTSKNGWIVHLWHKSSVLKSGSKAYRKYKRDVERNLGVDVTPTKL